MARVELVEAEGGVDVAEVNWMDIGFEISDGGKMRIAYLVDTI